MKFNERIIYVVVIAILALGWLKWPNTSVKIETIPGDSIPFNIIIEKPIPYDTIIYVYDTLQLAGDTVFLHDTIKVYDDYFKMYAFKIDTSAQDVDVSINSLVTQNRLYKQNISILNNRETKVVTENNKSFGIGGIVGKGVSAPTISYLYKSHDIGIGYNFTGGGLLLKYEYKFSIK